MIIKGKSRGNAAQAGDYLSKQGKNERIALIETKGTIATDIKAACREMSALAKISQCEKFIYHASINPAEGENLTSKQWKIAVDILEQKLGLDGHQRIVVEHEKEGRCHRHILWNRVDPETLKAQRMSWNYCRHEDTAREIETIFNLEKVPGVHNRDENTPRPDRSPSHNEIEEGKRRGISIPKWRNECKEIAAATDGSGGQIIEALELQGYMVARGDKVPFVVLDPAGQPHRLNGTLGMRKASFVEAFKDIDPDSLQDVTEAQRRQKERQDKEREAKDYQKAASMYDRGGMASQQIDALREHRDRNRQAVRSGLLQKDVAGSQSDLREDKKEDHYSQRESLLKSLGVKVVHKESTTEQTDRKQQQKSQNLMAEYFEQGRAAATKQREEDNEKDNFPDRERER